MFRCQKILTPLDGSKLAERALAPAVALAEALSCKLILYRVVLPVYLALEPQLYEQMVQQSEDEALAYLRSVKQEIGNTAVPIEIDMSGGAAASSIIQYAQSRNIDLIVMSSHGRSGANRWVFGSVAEKVLRAGCCPTLIIRAQTDEDPTPFRRILVPLDGSALAEQALDPALSLAHALSADVSLLRVVEPAHVSLETLIMSQQADYIESHEREEAAAYLQTICARLADTAVPLHTEVRAGSIADAIVDYADRHNIDLIVMGSHGRSGLSRWLFGSVAEKVLRGAHCATFIMRGKETK